MADVILAVDVGATKVDVATFATAVGEAPRLLRSARYRSAGFSGVESVLADFRGSGNEVVKAVGIAAAGPLRDGRIHTTNLPWISAADGIAAQLGDIPVRLLNDLEAAAAGVLTLPEEAFDLIVAGVRRPTHRALLAPGTGLGQSILYWDGSAYRPYATEGGHVGFAPRDDEQIELLRFLRRRAAAVSYEHVLSGPGLGNLFDFVTGELNVPTTVAFSPDAAPGDQGASIGGAAVAGTCTASRASVRLYFRILAARAGDLALSAMALGGVEVGGGMVPKLLPALDRSEFQEVFVGVGPFARMLAEVPVRAVLEPRVALIGAALAAARELG